MSKLYKATTTITAADLEQFIKDLEQEHQSCLAKVFKVQKKCRELEQREGLLRYRIEQAKDVLKKQRNQLYKQFKDYDYDTRYAVYGAVSVAVREAIPYSTCWLHAFDPFQYP